MVTKGDGVMSGRRSKIVGVGDGEQKKDRMREKSSENEANPKWEDLGA